MLRVTLLSALLLSSISVSSPSRAEPALTSAADAPLAIIGIADGVYKEQGNALTWALKRTLDKSIEWNNVELGVTMEALISAARCPDVPNRACLSRVARMSGLKRFIWGTLTLKQGRVTAQLWLFGGGSTGSTAVLEYSSNMVDTFDEDLLRLANNGLTQLLGAIHFPVQVRSSEPKGTIVVDDVVVGNLEAKTANVAVTAGDHRFRLVLPDATVVARSVRVRVESTNHVRLDFISIPES